VRHYLLTNLEKEQQTNDSQKHTNEKVSFLKRKGLLFILALLLLTPLTSFFLSKQRRGSTNNSLAPVQPTVTVTGWFTTVWNGESHYTLTDNQGKIYELTINEEVVTKLGGPLELDRKRVTVNGEYLSQQMNSILVSSLQINYDGMESQ
jgi:hypothetical protein